MKIAIGCDHVGLIFKDDIIKHIKSLGHEVIDHGTHKADRTDYPSYAELVSQSIIKKEVDMGILLCGTGVGMSMAANKHKEIRAVVCSDTYSAKLSREHNNANILAMGSRVVGLELAKMILEEFLNAKFEGGRHAKRLEMYSENGGC